MWKSTQNHYTKFKSTATLLTVVKGTLKSLKDTSTVMSRKTQYYKDFANLQQAHL